jgi:hypothetical protein
MVEAHTCSGDSADARVYINDVRVPVTDVDIYMRKEGPLSMTRYAEGKIVSPWQGVDYVNAFNAIDDENQNEYDTVQIDIRDYNGDYFLTAFRGVVTGLGNGGGIQREWNFRAKGIGQLLDTIAAGKRFSAIDDLLAKNVLDYIISEINERGFLQNDIWYDTATGAPETGTNASDGNDGGVLESDIVNAIQDRLPFDDSGLAEEAIGIEKVFNKNRHTLQDVVTWFQELYNVRVWFVHRLDPMPLLATRDPHIYNHTAHYLDGNLQIENNDALSEIRPINTLVAKGDAKQSRTENGRLQVHEAVPEYANVKVRHKELYQRAGGAELIGDQREVNSKDKTGVENTAKNLLKKAVDQASGGDMQALLRTPIQPFDTIVAQPTCDGSPATDTSPLTYEVHRVHQKIRSEQPSASVLDVGVHTNVDEDIEVVESGWKDAR